MVRLFFVLVAVSLCVAAPVRAARADNGPHAVQGPTTDACAGCHRAHTAQAAYLLKVDVPGLCLTCHDGSGATTNVVDGLSMSVAGRGLKGGGFTNATIDSNWDGVAAPAAVTSSHTMDGTTPGTVWGNGAIGSGPGLAGFTMTCINCHNPHGGTTPTYRILRAVPVGSGATGGGVLLPDEDVKRYNVNSSENKYFGEVYFGGYWYDIEQMSAWCAQCHTRYDTYPQEYPNGPGHTDSGDPIFRYRHLTRYDSWIDCAVCHDPIIAPNPFDIDGPAIAHEPSCENCHVAHGTSAQTGSYSGSVAWPDGAMVPSGSGRSSLLRLDARGVCMGCHAR